MVEVMPNAFGIVGLEIDKKDDALNRLNDILQDVVGMILHTELISLWTLMM